VSRPRAAPPCESTGAGQVHPHDAALLSGRAGQPARSPVSRRAHRAPRLPRRSQLRFRGRGVKAIAASAAVACLLAGCGSVAMFKAYEGPERLREEGVLSTQFRDDVFSVADGVIVSIDGANLQKPAYAARVLAGAHWFGVLSTVRQASLKRQQFCA